MADKDKATWVRVTLKGRDWLVSSAGDIRVPENKTTYTRLRNGKEQTFTATFKERAVTPCKARNGYLEVACLTSGKRIKERVHRLVGLAFVDGYEEGLCINHINGVKTDNRPSNLEWVSVARNTEHAWETGLVNLRGENNPGHILTSKRVVYIRRLLTKGISANTLAVVADMDPQMIYRIRDGKAWKP